MRNSIRRKTINIQKDLLGQLSRLQKKNSCQLKTRYMSKQQNYLGNKFKYGLVYSQGVVSHLMNELFASMEAKAKERKEIRYYKSLVDIVFERGDQIHQILDPINQAGKEKDQMLNCQEQPLQIAQELLVRGNSTTLEAKKVVCKKSSLIMSTRKGQSKEIITSRKHIASNGSSKCLIRLPKQQFLERYRSIEALKFQEQEFDTKYEEFLRQKLSKDTNRTLTLNANKPTRMNNKERTGKFKAMNCTATEQFSFDYDGSAIPIKKLSTNYLQKVNILNPKCRINNKELIELKKAGVVCRGSQLKSIVTTDLDENINYCRVESEGQGVISKEGNEQISDLQNIEPKEQFEQMWKLRFNEIVKKRAIRLRQIKLN